MYTSKTYAQRMYAQQQAHILVPGILMISVGHLKIMMYAPPGYAGNGTCKLCVKELLHVPTTHPMIHSVIYLAFAVFSFLYQ